MTLAKTLPKLLLALAGLQLAGCAVVDAGLAEWQASLIYENPKPHTPAITFWQQRATGKKWPAKESYCDLPGLQLTADGRVWEKPTTTRSYHPFSKALCSGLSLEEGQAMPKKVSFSFIDEDGTRVGTTLDLSNLRQGAYANGGLIKVYVEGRKAHVSANRMRICRNVYTGSGTPHWCTKEGDVTTLATQELVPIEP